MKHERDELFQYTDEDFDAKDYVCRTTNFPEGSWTKIESE